MRKKKLFLNTIFSLTYQIVTVVCGLILPRLFLQTYGSQTNGLVSSISQFLGIISFVELGIGAVVQSALYKPLADSDSDKINSILTAAQKFFNKLVIILLGYVVILAFVYPLFVANEFDYIFTASLVVIISISSFAQFFIGIPDSLLLNADQKAFIQLITQIIALILNTVVCSLLVLNNVGIHYVKIATSIIFLLRPIVVRLYINRHYKIKRNVQLIEDPIQQRRNGVAQHVAAVVLDGTDTLVLTTFSTLTNVSIYNVYNLGVNGIKQVVISMTTGVQPLIGELWAKNEKEELKKVFSATEWAIHNGVIFCFGCTAFLIVPFVLVYTSGVTDANYNLPLFGLLLTLANGIHCLRLPYFDIAVKACNHYRQTQLNFIVTTIINVVVSIILVNFLGLIGVAIGTLVALLYQTIWMIIYVYKNLMPFDKKGFFKLLLGDIIFIVLGSVSSLFVPSFSTNFGLWIAQAFIIAGIWIGAFLLTNIIIHRNFLKSFLARLFLRKKNKKNKGDDYTINSDAI